MAGVARRRFAVAPQPGAGRGSTAFDLASGYSKLSFPIRANDFSASPREGHRALDAASDAARPRRCRDEVRVETCWKSCPVSRLSGSLAPTRASRHPACAGPRRPPQATSEARAARRASLSEASAPGASEAAEKKARSVVCPNPKWIRTLPNLFAFSKGAAFDRASGLTLSQARLASSARLSTGARKRSPTSFGNKERCRSEQTTW